MRNPFKRYITVPKTKLDCPYCKDKFYIATDNNGVVTSLRIFPNDYCPNCGKEII